VATDARYRPRNPEENPLYGVVAGHLEAFLARQRERDRNVPQFVEREFRSFLECGIVAHGFIRVHCDTCGLDRIVPYSCKHRGFCNSCCGRSMSGANASPIGRSHQVMADTAAHLVDRVFPRIPVRQWVLSLPYDLRYRLAYDASLVTDVLGVFTKTIFTSLIQRARAFGAVRKPQSGAVSFIQRFDSALRLNLHIHSLTMEAFSGSRCATVDGFSLHANVAIAAGDRARLERLAQYCARPPVAMERLERLDDGRPLYRFKRAWRDGTTHIILSPLEMLEKLSALIPAPRAHAVRYAGILAPAAKWRAVIVPATTTISAEIVSATDSDGTDTPPCTAECLATGAAAEHSIIEPSRCPRVAGTIAGLS